MLRAVAAGESDRLRAIRLESLRHDPGAFASTLAHEELLPAEWWAGWAALSQEGSKPRTFVVCGEADKWLGLALVRLADDQPGVAVIDAMWVAPEARRNGHSRALCEACREWAAGHGLHTVTLEVVEGNAAGLRAYESFGFSVVGETTIVVGGEDLRELVMVRAL